MTKFADLPADQQALLSEWQATVFRPTVLASAQSLGKLASAEQSYQAVIAPILATLDPTEGIPDNTALAGAGPLTAADVSGWMTAAASVLTDRNSPDKVAAYVKIAGIGVIQG